jgi:RimJ/RimL family protein N-acetyltransferase
MTTLRVREFSWRDIDRIYQITMNTFPRDLEMIGFEKKTFKRMLRPSHISKWIQKITHKHYIKVYVGEIGGKVVAVTTLTRIGAAWYVSGVMVDANHRGKGYGRKIVRTVCTNACSFGAERIILSVPEYRVPAKNLYKSLGFSKFERLIKYERDCDQIEEQRLPEGYDLYQIDIFDSRAVKVTDMCQSSQSARIYGERQLPPWYNRVLQRVFKTEITEKCACTVDNTWVGVYTFSTDSKKKGSGSVLIDLVPEHRGQGLEEALLARGLANTFTLGLPSLIVQVNQEHTELARACEALGFSQKGVLEGMVKVCK